MITDRNASVEKFPNFHEKAFHLKILLFSAVCYIILYNQKKKTPLHFKRSATNKLST